MRGLVKEREPPAHLREPSVFLLGARDPLDLVALRRDLSPLLVDRLVSAQEILVLRPRDRAHPTEISRRVTDLLVVGDHDDTIADHASAWSPHHDLVRPLHDRARRNEERVLPTPPPLLVRPSVPGLAPRPRGCLVTLSSGPPHHLSFAPYDISRVSPSSLVRR